MRVLQVGYGRIGREIWEDYRSRLEGAGHRVMVTDLAAEVPLEHVWDGLPVDLAVVVVDTPRKPEAPGLDYRQLEYAVAAYLPLAEFVLIRSTVGLDYLDREQYREHRERIGLSPEFYGATKWSRRGVVDLGLSIFTENVPEWFVSAVGEERVFRARPKAVVLAKLAENAYLATKVTFFHELALTCHELGIDPESVREMVTADPRIGPEHSRMEQPGWDSHCFNKDVPEFARAGLGSVLVQSAIEVNTTKLLPRRAPSEDTPEG